MGFEKHYQSLSATDHCN